MPKFCPICGEAYVEGACPNQAQHFKPMCLNCTECLADHTIDAYRCVSEANMNAALEKIKNAVPDLNYAVELSPLPLKNPQKKCKHWNPDEKLILKTLLTPFMPAMATKSDVDKQINEKA